MVFPGLAGAKGDAIPLHNEVLSKLDQLQGEVTILQGTILGVETKGTNVYTNVQTLQTTGNGVQIDVNGLETDMSMLKTDVGNVQTAVDDITTTVDLRGVKQNWAKKLDATNGDNFGCNSDRFTCVLGNQAKRDNETRFVWDRVLDSTGGFNGDGSRPWAAGGVAAINYCFNRETGGRKGWHMPMLTQLATLVDKTVTGVDGNGRPVKLPDGHPFVGVKSRHYWAATTNAEFPGLAGLVNFANELVTDGINTQDIPVWRAR